MGKAPAFQFYANDFIGATITWDAIACGMYIRLLCTQWVNGSIPDDQRRIAKAAGVDLAELQREWHLLEPKFPLDAEGTRKNLRLEEVRQRQSDVSNARKEAANTRWNSNANASAKSVQRKVKEKEKVNKKVEVNTEEQEHTIEMKWPGWAGPNVLNAWEEFKAYRWTTHKVKYKSESTEQHAVNLLAKYYKTGEQCVDGINLAMAKGWKFPVDPSELTTKPTVPATSPTLKPWMQ
jgi:uncharacterized protein YdaU (DUF1376 family)